MKRLALLLIAMGIASSASANGITGNVLKTNGLPVYPCKIDLVNRSTGQPVVVTGDTTLPNGHYNLVLPDGRYNMTFNPGLNSHTFQGLFNDARVQANTVTVNQALPPGQYFKGKVVTTTGNVVVQDGFILTCTVTDVSLFPITGARIVVRNPANHAKFFTPTNNTSATGVAQVVMPVGAWDVIAEPPPAQEGTLATTTAYSWNASADATLPNFALLAGKAVTGHLVGGSPAGAVVNSDIDFDKMIAPTFPRVETMNDFTDGLGNFTQVVTSGTYRVTFNPPVATKLLS